MIDIKVEKHDSGACQKCGQNSLELYLATLSQGNISKNYVLCRNCLVSLKHTVDFKNKKTDLCQPESVNNSNLSSASEASCTNNTNDSVDSTPNDAFFSSKKTLSKKTKKKPILILVSSIIIIGIIIGFATLIFPNVKSKNSFTIEGSWKNVGDTTCAQIQLGSIVTFDGKNCNVYSPADTYAFYKEKGEYHLDCTSFFAGDSMNFIVNIIDNDNIELEYVTGTIIKLRRVTSNDSNDGDALFNNYNEADDAETSFQDQNQNQKVMNLTTNDIRLDCGFYQFSEGLSWVKLKSEQSYSDQSIAVINENGNVVYILDTDKYDLNGLINVTPFKNGFSCVFTTSGSYGTDVNEGVLVVTKDGIVKEWLADYLFYDIADDDTIFMQKNISDFSNNYWELFVFDKSGNVESTGITSEKEIYRNTVTGIHISDKIYYFYNDQGSYHENIIFDLENKRLHNKNPGTQFHFINIIGDDLYLSADSKVFCCTKSKFAEIISSTSEPDVIYNEICSCTIIDPHFESNEYSLVGISDVYGKSAVYKYKYSNSTNYIYTDFSGKLLGKYPDDANIFHSYGYSDGYFHAIEKGADGNKYLSVYNEDFKRIYQPVIFPGSYDVVNYRNYYDSFSGYFFLNVKSTYYFYDRTGNQICLGDNFDGLSNTSYFVGENVVISNGWIFCNDSFATIDGSKQITTASVLCDSDGNTII